MLRKVYLNFLTKHIYVTVVYYLGSISLNFCVFLAQCPLQIMECGNLAHHPRIDFILVDAFTTVVVSLI